MTHHFCRALQLAKRRIRIASNKAQNKKKAGIVGAVFVVLFKYNYQ